MVIGERFHFDRRDQAPAETVAVYVAELQRLATTCDFGDYPDQALRDRFVCGLRSEAIQKSLLSETELDFTRAIKVAQGIEAVHKNTQTLKGPELIVGTAGNVTQPLNLLPVGKLQFAMERSQIATVEVGLAICCMNVTSRRPYVIMAGGEDT